MISEVSRVASTFESIETNVQKEEECSKVPVEKYKNLQWQGRVSLPHCRIFVHHPVG
jgi:hypothetical protein